MRIVWLCIFNLIFVISGCGDSKKAEEKSETEIAFNIPELLTMSEDQIIDYLGKPKYTSKMAQFSMNSDRGNFSSNTPAAFSSYLSGEYRIDICYIREKKQQPISIFIGKKDAQILDSAGMNNIKIAGAITDESRLPKEAFLSFSGNGINVINFGKQ